VEVLRALGSTPRQRLALHIGAVVPALVIGLAIAPIVAIALSPAFPVGIARRLDPDVGVHVDAILLLIGTVGLAAVVVALITIGAVRLVRRPRSGDGVMSVPNVIDRAARALPPAPSVGVRFALHAARQVSTPVRPALLGALVGVIGLAAVAVVGASLDRLIDTPARWGTAWDVAITGENPDQSTRVSDEDRAELLAADDVEAAAVLIYDEQLTIDGVEAISMTVDSFKGEITPTVVRGREPRSADEIALARDTFDEVDKSIGDRVAVVSRGSAESQGQLNGEYRIVGVIAFPSVGGNPTPLTVGAALTAAGGARLDLGNIEENDDAGSHFLVVRWASGVDGAAAVERLGDRYSNNKGPIAPPEVTGLEDVRLFPLLVAAALALLGSIAIAHALVVTVRRRRLELGILSSLGFAPSQRRAVILVQATTVALVALLVGVPLGAVVGRLTWSVIARSIGVATDARFPLLTFALGALALIVALNLIAAWPARSARRLRVATALRSE
jgi:hypothetical protein